MSSLALEGKRIWIAGHRGMVGRALTRCLSGGGYQLLTAERGQVDLRRQDAVESWMRRERPEVIFLAAAKVGGIHANNTQPGEFLYDNLMIEANVIECAKQIGVEKLIFLGSTCIYPKFAPQPIAEDALLTGPLEPTNEWYAIAKIAGIKLCQAYRRQFGCDFIAAQPTNLYGPFDNFDLDSSHVLPALIRKAHEARKSESSKLQVWGSGKPLREFLHVDDLADALVFLAENYSGEDIVNVGSGREISIGDLARLVADVVGTDAEVIFDTGKPDGTPRKMADTSRLSALGWTSRIALEDGIRSVYHWFLEQEEER